MPRTKWTNSRESYRSSNSSALRCKGTEKKQQPASTHTRSCASVRVQRASRTTQSSQVSLGFCHRTLQGHLPSRETKFHPPQHHEKPYQWALPGRHLKQLSPRSAWQHFSNDAHARLLRLLLQTAAKSGHPCLASANDPTTPAPNPTPLVRHQPGQSHPHRMQHSLAREFGEGR